MKRLQGLESFASYMSPIVSTTTSASGIDNDMPTEAERIAQNCFNRHKERLETEGGFLLGSFRFDRYLQCVTLKLKPGYDYDKALLVAKEVFGAVAVIIKKKK